MHAMSAVMVVMPPGRISSPALEYAANFAHKANAVLQICVFDAYLPIDYCRAVFGTEVAERARGEFLEDRELWLAERAAVLVRAGLRVECRAFWAPHRCRTVIDQVRQLRPSLVPNAMPGGAGLRFWPSGLDRQLLRLCPAPVLLVQPGSSTAPRRVLAAVDIGVSGEAGRFNDRVIETAACFAALHSADLNLASVLLPPPVAPYATGFVAEAHRMMAADHRGTLGRFAERHHIAPERVLSGCADDPAQQLGTWARDVEADLLVLGSTSDEAGPPWHLGSTAEALLRQPGCNVLLLKPDGIDSGDVA